LANEKILVTAFQLSVTVGVLYWFITIHRRAQMVRRSERRVSLGCHGHLAYGCGNRRRISLHVLLKSKKFI